MNVTADSRVPTTDRRVWTATGREPQVFLDPSGRRARIVRAIAALGATVVLCGPIALVAGATGFSALPSVKVGRAPTLRFPSPATATILAWRSSPSSKQRPASAPARAVGS